MIAREQDAAERVRWDETFPASDLANLVFLDETSTPLTMMPRRARAPRGQRAIGRVPRGRWEAVSLLATLTTAGMGPAVQFAGAVDRPLFEQFVGEWLVPWLRPGQVVIWDNLSVHKSARARALIEAAGCRVLALPRYSPDFNPIELAFAKLKQALRRAAARTFDAVVTATGHAFATITPRDAQHFIAAAGSSPFGHDLSTMR